MTINNFVFLQKKMTYQTIRLISDFNIRIIELDYPEKLNSQSQVFFDEFDDAIELIHNDADAKVLIIRGLVSVFSAGGNLKEIAAADYEKSYLMCLRVQNSFRSLHNLNIPVIAALSGIVYGGGFELALHCDIRFASENTDLRLPEAELGLIPGAGGTSLLSKIISPADAAYYLYSGNSIPIDVAKSKGLIQAVYKSDELYSKTLEFAKNISLKSTQSLAAIKKIQVASLYKDLNSTYNLEAREFSSVLQTSGKTGIRAFFDKKNKIK